VKPNGKAASMSVTVSLEAGRPLLDEGSYRARCTEATIAWSKRWKKWIALLHMDPLDYVGRPYTGELCKFLFLGTDQKKPRAGPSSAFRKLWVEVNGAQPNQGEVDLGIFVGHVFEIAVRTVRAKADKEKTPIPEEHWYSVVGDVTFSKAAQTTRQHRQHSNTSNTHNTHNTDNTTTPTTPQPINTLTLKQTQQHLNTTTHPRPNALATSKRTSQSNSSLGDTQQTHNVHPDNTGTEGAIVSSVPDGQADTENSVSQDELAEKVRRSRESASRWREIVGHA
jgi:hypothetical protein